MSFLDSVLSSLESGNSSQDRISRPPAAPVSSSATKKDDKSSGNFARQSAPNGTVTGNTTGGIKRKAEEQLPRLPRPDGQTPGLLNTKPAIPSVPPKVVPGVPKSASAPSLKTKTTSPKPVSRNVATGQAKPASKPAPVKATPVKPTPSKPTAPAKPPPKGSFAAIMEAAKAAQGKAPSQIGVIRHQSAPKENLSKVERQRRLLEAQQKKKAEQKGQRFEPSSLSKGKVVGKKAEPQVSSYKGTAKPSKAPEPAAYRGTANLPSKRSNNDRRQNGRRRVDEYLGTDEEDEGDYGGGGYDDYSDASSDMEAGFDDVANEEDTALKSARREDEEELRMEMAAKKAKLQRQQKLAALASRTKR
ncbi:hypothetical protein N7532_000468 [Penicillium argentinense]|uniref:Chromatin SPT2 n=1 Tax=Penicillium argentinense TaxID=1131581 RepID=A0A9W9KNX0_9EURO|nr:uncharacterized protein N7532_000468 [Penicillium argentinense]KAJ5112423.1 hypothetical protein N7532_000468 [Penicillium argentinense]